MGFVFKALTMCACFAAPWAANAELIYRGDGMLYDTVLDVTWLQDANYARSSGYDADGRMTWDEATEWAENLVYAGLDDWRLPNLGDPFTELDYMFYINLGNTGYGSAPAEFHADYANFNRGPFANLEAYFYWTSTNDQSMHPQSTGPYAWAVRDGDVTIEELLAALHRASIDVGPGRTLERKAELALTYYTAGDTFATCVAMSDYVLTLIDYTEKKKPKVTPDLASALLGDAERIIVTITCD